MDFACARPPYGRGQDQGRGARGRNEGPGWVRRSAQFVHEDPLGGALQGQRLLDHPPVMGEEDHLGAGGEVGQGGEGGAGAFVVELDEDVVDDEGQGWAPSR